MLLELRRPENPGGYTHALYTHLRECLPDLGLGVISTLEDKIIKTLEATGL